MLDSFAGGEWLAALLNVVLLALWSALPMLLLAYVHQSLVLRQARPDFFLRKSEAAELERALALYRDVHGRLAEIEAQARTAKGILKLVFALQSYAKGLDEEERDDLKAHGRHLQATIAELRGLPLRRLRERIAALSFHFAVGGAVTVHAATFVIFVLTLYFADVRDTAREMAGTGRSALVWYPFDASYFLANGASAAVGMFLAPAFYLGRRIGLVRQHGMEFTVLKALAGTPAEEIAEGAAGRTNDAESSSRVGQGTDKSCFAVLGVEQSANLEQVRAAYRMRIKQSHPDRLHGVSPAIRSFAEDETKRLNAAFQEALERLA